MGKLMKYELRKTMFAKTVLLVITGIAELLFLLGVFLEWENGLGIGMVGLVLCAIIGTFYIGLQSITIFEKDLHTKQSYMLFLTPRNNYQILGAKVIENGVSLILANVFFVLLAMIDVSTAVLYLGGLEEFLDLLHEIAVTFQFDIDIAWKDVCMVVAMMITFWLLIIQTGYLAIVLTSTVFSGKKFSGVLSFIAFILISWLVDIPSRMIPELENPYMTNVLVILVTLIMVALMYVLTAWIMERKLSV